MPDESDSVITCVNNPVLKLHEDELIISLSEMEGYRHMDEDIRCRTPKMPGLVLVPARDILWYQMDELRQRREQQNE